MDRKYDVITIGGAVRDIVFFTDKGRIFKTPEDLTAQRMWAFEYGAKIIIPQAHYALGGGALNCAYNLKKMGLKVTTILRVGKDPDGECIIQDLEKNQIPTDFVQFDKTHATGFSLILTTLKKEREHVAFLYRGANDFLEVDEKVLRDFHTKWLYISSLSGNDWLKNLKNIFQCASSQKAHIAWNPGNLQIQAGKKILETFLKNTDILFLNKDEAIELVLSGIHLGKRDPKFLNKPVYLLNILNDWGVKTVVITLGESGATSYRDGKIYFQKAIKKKVVDTTGVGDAFATAFLSGCIYEANTIERALLWGVENSAHVLTKVGAHNGVLSKKEMIECLRKYNSNKG